MATVLPDTSVIIDAINNKKRRRQLHGELVNQGNSLACCPINVTDFYAGLRLHEEASTKTFLTSLDLFPMTRLIAHLVGLLKFDYSKNGQTRNLCDVMIGPKGECRCLKAIAVFKRFRSLNRKLENGDRFERPLEQWTALESAISPVPIRKLPVCR
jgi:predicted nucleic acid-binding protein